MYRTSIFTVYGPAGRPDMAYFSFTGKLLAGEKIRIYNYGNGGSVFTYIDDIVGALSASCRANRYGRSADAAL